MTAAREAAAAPIDALGRHRLVEGDALEAVRAMPDESVDLIVADPPYFRVKSEKWDRQWDSGRAFVEWLELHVAEWVRVLRPNGSMYVFASPQMAARVECAIADRAEVLASVTWAKPFGPHKRRDRSVLRTYATQSERIIFAEKAGADGWARGEAGYVAECDKARGMVFEPLRAYLDGERQRAGVSKREVMAATGTQMARHWFGRSQWALPTAEHYATLRRLFNGDGDDHLRREYDDLRREYDHLRREYDHLRREYDDLRRPFDVGEAPEYTDVWTFAPVLSFKGKHVCEKPSAMIEHIVAASSLPGAVVLDPFAGSGITLAACDMLGRAAVLVERDAGNAAEIRRRWSAWECGGDWQPAQRGKASRRQVPLLRLVRGTGA